MDVIIVPFLNVIYAVLSLSSWFLLIHIIISWLIMFGVLNMNTSLVFSIVSFFSRFAEMFTRPFRRFIPVMAGIDVPLFAALLAIYFVQGMIARILMRFVFV